MQFSRCPALIAIPRASDDPVWQGHRAPTLTSGNPETGHGESNPASESRQGIKTALHIITGRPERAPEFRNPAQAGTGAGISDWSGLLETVSGMSNSPV